MTAPDVVDVCAGIGGWDLALARRGLSSSGVELAKHPRATRELNGLATCWDDVETLAAAPAAVPAPRLGLVGSPPCQPFSQANGAALGLADPRASVGLAIATLAEAWRPAFVCLEQVRRAAPLFDLIAERLRALGYTVDSRVVSAADHGLPQDRKRLLLAARLDGAPIAWPAPSHAGRHVTLAAALPDRELPAWAHRRPAPTVVGSFCPEVLAEPRYRGPGDVPRQKDPNGVVVDESERLLLQGFPEGWRLAGGKTARGLQLGNAVPPLLAGVALDAAGVVDLAAAA